jgi:hypothetical protein
MAVRPDVRLETAPMQQVRCERCAAVVEVRKSSWDQTSIQWHEDALAACPERRRSVPRPGPNGDFFPGCPSLRDTIRRAAVTGRLAVQDEQ